MIIENGVLISINDSDLTKDGELYIPNTVKSISPNVGEGLQNLKKIFFPDSLTEISNKVFCNNHNLEEIFFGESIKNVNSDAFSNCFNVKKIQIPSNWCSILFWSPFATNNLKTIIKNTENGQKTFNIGKYANMCFYEKSKRTLFGINIIELQRLNFNKTDICGSTYYAIKIKDFTYTGLSLREAINKAKKDIIINEFKHHLWLYKTKHEKFKHIYRIENILFNSLNATLSEENKINNITREKLRNYTKILPVVIKNLDFMLSKYPYASIDIFELHGVSIEKLIKKIFSRNKSYTEIKKKTTHLLKRHPVSFMELSEMAFQGYQNPGCFPYEWLKGLPSSNIKKATTDLHQAFRRASIKTYTTENNLHTIDCVKKAIEKLEADILKITGKKAKIEYLSSGNFTKNYVIKFINGQKYVWKTYHSDRDNQYISTWAHDTITQNSFLLSGKKYMGKIKFNKIFTAGISTQRGERYIIQPYVYGKIDKIPENYFMQFKFFSLYDFNEIRNRFGNTIIDVGAITINKKAYNRKTEEKKILNTILYQSWEDLYFILNNYSSKQVYKIIDEISKNLFYKTPNYNTIIAKITFLKNKLNSRGYR